MAILNLKSGGVVMIYLTLVAIVFSHSKTISSSEESPEKSLEESPEALFDQESVEIEEEENEKHRIVTDYTEVETGVPVDFHYNESSKGYNDAGLNSVPGCPKSEQGVPWVYYGRPPKCYLAGEKGPCPVGQILFLENNTPFGYCNCACFKGSVRATGNKVQFCEVDHQRFVLGYAFLPNLKQCYELYDQGPCKNKEWLAKVSSTQVQCEERRCEDDSQYPLNPTIVDRITCGNRVASFSFSNGLEGNNCKAPEAYSSLLKKCISSSKLKF